MINKEIQGFVLNRLQAALLLESWELVKAGYISVQDLDQTIKDGLGYRWSFMGPFETIDLNAANGVKDYANTFGNTYHKMMENEGYPEWDEHLINRVDVARRDILPLPDIKKREKWRDIRLMEFIAHKSDSKKKHGD